MDGPSGLEKIQPFLCSGSVQPNRRDVRYEAVDFLGWSSLSTPYDAKIKLARSSSVSTGGASGLRGAGALRSLDPVCCVLHTPMLDEWMCLSERTGHRQSTGTAGQTRP